MNTPESDSLGLNRVDHDIRIEKLKRDARVEALGQKQSRGTPVRRMGHKSQVSYETYRTYVETRPPEVVANILICVLHQTNYLLDRQIARLEQDFLKDGGLRERMTRARLATRSSKK